MNYRTTTARSFAISLVAFGALSLARSASAQYIVHNLVSDGAVPADFTDPNLVNPWGIAMGPTSPLWISDNGPGLSTLYTGDGVAQSLVVTIPPSGSGFPTGVVFNGGTGFVVSGNGKSGPSRFIFGSENGTILGWSPAVDLFNAQVLVDWSGVGAKYKGIALATVLGHDFIYGANFTEGMVDVFDSNANFVMSFTDNHLPAGYAPFNVQLIEDKLIVTFALRGPTGDDVGGAGHGYVDVFSTTGHLIRRLVKRGALNSPWGVALAPKHWGRFSRKLLIGNFGDGKIHAYDLHDGDFEGTLRDTDHKAIVIDGLWSLTFGMGGVNAAGKLVNGETTDLFFTAGTNGEADGLLGKITVAPHGDGDGDD